MKYRKLGRTGFDVSDVAHGLWGMSGWSGSDDRESLDSMRLAVELGMQLSSIPRGRMARARAMAYWARSWRRT